MKIINVLSMYLTGAIMATYIEDLIKEPNTWNAFAMLLPLTFVVVDYFHYIKQPQD